MIVTTSLSPRRLTAAPHRLLFFIGASNVLLAMAWWTLWLLHAQLGWQWLPASGVYAGWMHALVMQYQLLPAFMFGFLLTVFPRWMGLPDFGKQHYVPTGLGLLGGQMMVLLSLLTGIHALLLLGWAMTAAGWAWGVWHLGRLLLAEHNAGKGPTWHARSCWVAMAFGLLGVLMVLAALLGAPAWLMQWTIKLGTFALLLPVYVTVAHRMFPFFAGNVVAGYKPWRPMWLLAAFWPLFLAHLALELASAHLWLWLADVPLLVLSAWLLWRWWPRAAAPGLLWVLFIGFAWLPMTFALYSLQSLSLLADAGFTLGRGPAHALFIGFFGSLLVAMVTRVTQGHSGQPLLMPAVGWFAFITVQLVTLLRIVAEATSVPMLLHVLAALGWLLAFTPWALRHLRIYLQPRVDGKAG